MSRQESVLLPSLSKPIIIVDKLSKTFSDGKIRAVDSVSFEVEEGEIFGFLGPNGAGKTTTINMLTTILRPSSGNANVCGHDVYRHPNEVRRSVGVVPQEYTADEDMTGYDSILLCADLYGIPRSDSKPHADELLGLVELHDAANRKEADALCDRIAIIDHGHIVKIGSPEELKASIGGDVITVTVREREPDISSDIAGLDLVRDVKQIDGAYRVKVKQGEEAAPQIMDMIRSKGLHVTKIALTKPTLDEAYLEFTGGELREEETDRMQMFSQRLTMRRARS